MLEGRCSFVPALAKALCRSSLRSSSDCCIYCSKTLFLSRHSLTWTAKPGGEARSPAWQSEINQSNQKNIMECISAGRCYSLPSSSIDLQSRS